MIIRNVTRTGTKIIFLKEWAVTRDTFDGYPPTGTVNHLTTSRRPKLKFSPNHETIKNERELIKRFYKNEDYPRDLGNSFWFSNGKRYFGEPTTSSTDEDMDDSQITDI